jgi:hypothetical protein
MSQVQINIEQRSLQFLIRKKQEAKQCAKIPNANKVVMKVPNVETNNENLDDLKEENKEPNAKINEPPLKNKLCY